MADGLSGTPVVKPEALIAGGEPWSRVAWLAPLMAILLGTLYWQTLRDLALQWWDDPNYTHGFLVPVFSGYLVWWERAAHALRGSPSLRIRPILSRHVSG